jgi:hypothetical protein
MPLEHTAVRTSRPAPRSQAKPAGRQPVREPARCIPGDGSRGRTKRQRRRGRPAEISADGASLVSSLLRLQLFGWFLIVRHDRPVVPVTRRSAVPTVQVPVSSCALVLSRGARRCRAPCRTRQRRRLSHGPARRGPATVTCQWPLAVPVGSLGCLSPTLVIVTPRPTPCGSADV